MTSTYKPARTRRNWPSLSPGRRPKRGRSNWSAVAPSAAWAVRSRSTVTVVPAKVDLSGIAGVVFYEPEELVISVRPGTPLEQVNRMLAERNQMLAFEPLDWGWLLCGESKYGTIGGAISVGSSGPRRVKAGAARDFVLGAHAVNGRGECFKSGGRVVKNVTGYDLHKLMTGAYGTLGAFTEITLKVLPAPEKTHTLLIHGLKPERAVEALTRGGQQRRSRCRASRICPPPRRHGRSVSVCGPGWPRDHRDPRRGPRRFGDAPHGGAEDAAGALWAARRIAQHELQPILVRGARCLAAAARPPAGMARLGASDQRRRRSWRPRAPIPG